MELTTAISLIQNGITETPYPQTWADLGAGQGLFTHALSTRIQKQSKIYAIDRSKSDLQFVKVAGAIHLEKVTADFVKDEIGIGPLDGAIMANALHFVKDPVTLLLKIRKNLKPTGQVIIVEYEMTAPNQWVPYPIGFDKILVVAKQSGFDEPIRLAETQSVFNSRKIYSALLKRE